MAVQFRGGTFGACDVDHHGCTWLWVSYNFKRVLVFDVVLTKNRTYLLFGSFSVSMIAFVWFFIPETKGLSLEAMDELFGVTDDGKVDSDGPKDSTDHKRIGATTEVEVR